MRTIRTLAFAALLCAASSLHLAHAADAGATAPTCLHDEPDIQREQARLLQRNGAAVQAYAPSVHTQGGRLFHAQQAQPIRIVFSFEDLTEAGAFCANASGTAPSYRQEGETVACTKEAHVLTDAKRAILRDNILPAAVAKLQRFIAVEPVQGNLRASSTSTCGGDFTVPASHASTGVPNADLVVYVASSPILGSTVAFAGACQQDQNGRAVFGRMNFGTENIEWDAIGADARQSLIDTAVHEILHVMGITSTEFFRTGRSTTATKRGKTVRMVTTPSVRSFVRQWSGCSTLEGAEVEDEQTSGPEGSHWERKLFYDEMMTASGSASAISGLSLSFLQDMNVGYTVTVAAGETMYWGANDGCGPHDNKCDTAAGLRDKYFCFDDPSNRPDRCTWDVRGIGRCQVGTYSGALPSHFQYYSSSNVGGISSFMDKCPVVLQYSNRNCASESPESDNDRIFGYTYSATSRCFQSTGVIRSGFSSSANIDGPRCVEARCNGGASISFSVGGAGSYTQCGAAGTTQPAGNGYNGQVTCPVVSEMCSSLDSVSATPAPTPAPTLPDGSTTTPPPTTTTAAPSTPAPPSGGGGLEIGGVTIGSSAGRAAASVGGVFALLLLIAA
uniref:Leishmanolysin-like peptidase n=1 Tax=Neobodo designis TaxID=312471 RepID=A0A7S1LBB8_NEODS